MPLYFAYGSNMDRAQMASRCPASRPLGTARLVGRRFVIMREGYASVTPDRRRTVWGLLWDLSLADVPALDRYEGVSGGLYTKAVQAVLTATGSRRALVYLGCNAGPGQPRPGYLEGVLAAGREQDLPAAYLRELAAWASTGRGRAGSVARMAARSAVTPTRRTPREDLPSPTPPGWSWTP